MHLSFSLGSYRHSAYATCPKCQEGGLMGPRYEKKLDKEVLIYTCSTCGFKEERPTVDKAPPAR